jgi:rod shape-determining protein MreC
MAVPATSGIARRRATVRRGVIAVLAVACLIIFTGYFREGTDGPLHGVQATSASVIAPVQEGATRAVLPFRDAWGWMTSLKDARDRAANLQDRVDDLEGLAADNAVRDQRITELESLLGVDHMLDTGKELGGYRRAVGLVLARSVTDWYRSARIDVGSSSGVLRNSPVVAGTNTGAALVGYVTSVSPNSSSVAFITDGRTEVGATIPEAGNYPGVLQSTTPGQLQLTGVPRAAGIRQGQTVVTSGFQVKNLLSVYPPGIPVGAVTSFGSQEVDVQQTVQVTPFIDPRKLTYLVVLVPESPKAKERAAG